MTSLGDVFGLNRADTPEWPRYHAALQACAAHAERHADREPMRLCDVGGYFGVLSAAIGRLGYDVDLVDSYGPLLSDEDHADLHSW